MLLNTDASFRFERGIDINLCEYAIKRAAIINSRIWQVEKSASDISWISTLEKDRRFSSVLLKLMKKLNRVIGAGNSCRKKPLRNILVSLEIKSQLV